MTFYSGPREGQHLLSEANGFRSREPAVATSASRAAMHPGMLVQAAVDATKVEPYTGARALKGVVYGFANENGDVALTARDAEVIGARTAFRTFTPTKVTGTAANPVVSPSGNLTINGQVLALADNSSLAAVVTAINDAAAVPFVSAAAVDGHLVITHSAGGSITVAGTAGVLADLGLVSGTTAGKTRSALRAEDTAALAALGIVVR